MAKQFFGVSAHAGMHAKFPWRKFMRQFPDDLKLGCITILSGSFGWTTALISAFAGRFAENGLVEVYLSNGCARRSRSEKGDFAGNYSIKRFDEALIDREAHLVAMVHKRLDKIQSAIFDFCPACVQVICPELEDNMSDEGFQALCKIIKEHRPGTILARNPCKGGRDIKGAKFYERHGMVSNGQRGQVINMDGWSLDAKDGATFFQQASEASVKRMLDNSEAYASFIWSARQQGYPNLHDWSQKPPKRKRTFEVSDQEISMVRRLLSGR